MIATFSTVTIIDQAAKLAKDILDSEPAQDYYNCLKRVQKDTEAQEKIYAFTSMKEAYEEVQRFGRYHPDYRKVSLGIREAKREMDLHQSIADFKRAETNLQQLLDEISALIGNAVSPHVKVPASNPFFETASSGCASGSCGTGGGCGCS